MPELIAIVDDEEDLLNAVKIALKKEGYGVKGFTSAEELFKFTKNNLPAAFILDIMLPGQSGFDICKQLRASENFAKTPVLFLSARGDEFDKVLGFDIGGDDYITKPFSPKELVARVKAVLRRASLKQDSPAVPAKGIVINKENMEVYSSGKKTELTITEFRILELLLSKKGKVFSREQILDYVWGEDKIVTDRTIDVHIKNLREKLGRNGGAIQNIRSIGYKFNA